MEREMATQRADLPHTFEQRVDGSEPCALCGGLLSAPLHNSFPVEQAAHRETLRTEKGS